MISSIKMDLALVPLKGFEAVPTSGTAARIPVVTAMGFPHFHITQVACQLVNIALTAFLCLFKRSVF